MPRVNKSPTSKPSKPKSPTALKREAKAAARAAKLAKSLTPEAIKAAAKAREARLRLIFNTTSEEYEKVLAYQNGVCAITGRQAGKNALAVDHCHLTGELRGLLSQQANKGLALFQDNADWLRRAADYLDNPPYRMAVGEPVYGILGRVTKRAKNRTYGPLGTKTPQPRLKPLYRQTNTAPKKMEP